MCDQIATISEYMTPKYLFPGEAGLGNRVQDYRDNMIFVPSCEKHYHDNSLDDEHLANSVLMAMAQREEPLVLIFDKSTVKMVDSNELSQQRVLSSLEKRVR